MKTWPLIVFPLVGGAGGAIVALPTQILVEKIGPYASNVVTCETRTNKASITSSVKKLEKGDDLLDIELTIKNLTSKPIKDASITVLIRDKDTVKLSLGTIPADQEIVKTITRDQINKQLEEKGKKIIKSGHKLSFLLVREGSFKVENNRLYKADEFNQFSLVSDTELESSALAGKFVVYDDDTQEFDTEDNFAEYLGLLQNGETKSMWLINGEYQVVNVQGYPNPATLKINGLNNSKGVKTSGALKIYNDTQTLVYANSINFYLNNINVNCQNKECTNTFYDHGFQCPVLQCDGCYFTGTLAIYTLGAKFNNCTFDGRCVYQNEGGTWKARDCNVIYTDSYCDYNKCTFLNCGKAVKIYTNNNIVHGENNFIDCTFQYDMSKINKEWEERGLPKTNMPVPKPPIEIDSRLMLSGYKLSVNLINPVMVNYPSDTIKGNLVHDDYTEPQTEAGVFYDCDSPTNDQGEYVPYGNGHHKILIRGFVQPN